MLQTGLNGMKWSFLFLLTTCSDIDVYLPCSVLPPVSVPHMSFCLHSYCIHQILDSVSYAHQHDIVHRDLKVCVCLCVCVCIAAHFIFLHLSSPCVQWLLFICSCSFVSQTCLCLLFVHLFVCLFFFNSLVCPSLGFAFGTVFALFWMVWSRNPSLSRHHTRMLVRAAYKKWCYWHFWTDSTVKCAG